MSNIDTNLVCLKKVLNESKKKLSDASWEGDAVAEDYYTRIYLTTLKKIQEGELYDVLF